MRQEPITTQGIRRRRMRGRSQRYTFKGQVLSRMDYWVLKISENIRGKSSLNFTQSFNIEEQKKILILMRLWGVRSPVELVKCLIDENYSLIQIKKLNQDLEKRERD